MLKIRELRENLGLTQRDLGVQLGIEGHNIGDWERLKCEPSSDMLIKLADFFDCTIDYLLGREDDFGNIMTKSTQTPGTEDEQTLLSAFRVLDNYEKESLLIQATALAKKKLVIKK